MLSVEDVDRVKEYFYAGFPELRGRVTVRLNDPPRMPTKIEAEKPFYKAYREAAIWEQKDRVLGEILEQTPPELHRDVIQAFEKVTVIGKQPSVRFLEVCHEPYPWCLPITPENVDKNEAKFFYVTQFSHVLSDSEIYETFAQNKVDTGLPENFRRVFGVISLAHEMGHAGYNLATEHREECLCDIFGIAAAANIIGRDAVAGMGVFHYVRTLSARNYVPDKEGDENIHGTGKVLKHVMEAPMELATLGPSDVLMRMERLYHDVYQIGGV